MSKVMQLYSFPVDLKSVPEIPLYALSMPKPWRDYLAQFKEGEYKYRFKLHGLGDKLEAVFPSIISSHFSTQVVKDGKPWIIATEKLDLDVITQMFLSWLKVKAGNGVTDPGLLRQLQELPDWDWSTFDLERDVYDESILYKVVPGLFAHSFCREPVYFDIGGQELSFYPIAAAENGYECMSEPIQRKGGAFSYVLRLRLVTRGLRAEQKCLNVRVGIRRFVLQPVIEKKYCLLRWQKRSSIYLSLNNPYIKQDRVSFAKLFAVRDNRREQERKTKWEDEFEEYCSDLVSRQHLSTDAIYCDPKAYFQGVNGIRAFITYSPAAFTINYGAIRPGAGLYERKTLFERFQERFPQLNLLPPLPSIEVRDRRERKPVPPKRDSIYTLEVWSKDMAFFQAVCEQTGEILDTSPSETLPSSVSFPVADPDTGEIQWELRVVHKDPGVMVSPLDDRLATAKETFNQKGIQKRIGEIRRFVEQAREKPMMALVEIEDYPNHEQPTMRKNDPKHAVRIGMLRTGRITQFIHPFGDDEQENTARVQNALYDLFSDRGFLDSRWHFLQHDAMIVGFDYLYPKIEWTSEEGARLWKRGIIPIMSWVRNGEVYVKIGRRKWETFDRALLSFDPYAMKEQTLDQGLIEGYVAKEVQEILAQTEQQVYLFVNAALRRHLWHRLANDRIQLDQLPFEHAFAGQERLRVIRINTTDEVPYADVPNVKGEPTRGQGLFKDSPGIYYSVGARPDTMQISKEKNKWENPRTMIVKQRVVEIIPLGCSTEEERDQLAILTHQLRQVSLTYKEHTILPYPLKRLQAFEKYMKSMDEVETVDGFEELGDESD
ncbi:MAG: hypothetical protein BAA01_05380 [Bacillus thermozeamaize]|uniref:DUF3893 domain-containing protein n=1 Tax=Bacillus thermozeamaize TaxID=230954 RepID=A0A1Y3PME3_9BACI|nr:MAG: hypothetical protein BAA01_05380 [Bacillus thermozeamaize]